MELLIRFGETMAVLIATANFFWFEKFLFSGSEKNPIVLRPRETMTNYIFSDLAGLGLDNLLRRFCIVCERRTWWICSASRVLTYRINEWQHCTTVSIWIVFLPSATANALAMTEWNSLSHFLEFAVKHNSKHTCPVHMQRLPSPCPTSSNEQK